MATIAEALAAALDHHMAGRLAEAEILYGRILAVEEEQADALHLLGVLYGQTGRLVPGIDLLRRAVRLRPDAAAMAANLANAAEGAGDDALAVAARRLVVLDDPAHGDGWARLGPALWRLGRGEQAEKALAHAAALVPGDGEARGRLGMVRHALGGTEHRAGRLEAARAWLAGAAAVLPAGHDLAADARVLLGLAHHGLGERTAAERDLHTALALDPAHADALSALCALMGEAGRHEAAAAVGRRAVRAAPLERGGWVNRAAALDRCWRYGAALDAGAGALALDPAHAGALANRGGVLLAQGDGAAALVWLDRAVRVAPGDAALGQRRLCALPYRPGLTGEDVRRESAAWAVRHAPAVAARPVVGDGGGRLRVGMVSGDFRNHAFAFYMEPLFRALDRGAVELCLYSTVTAPDARTERFRGLADRWCDAGGLSDAALAARIRADGVQVLVDLSSHTEGNRLAVFARRPAPVQATIAVTVVTTGLDAFDAVILDPWLAPSGAETQYSEPVLRLPRFAWAYRGPEEAPDVTPPPCRARGYVTFASFNNLSKLTPEVAALWARVLRAAPGSRLLLKYPALRDAGARAFVTGLFAPHGVADRLELRRPPSGIAANLGDYADADIALDPFPYNGHTTTCEALWMGVPVVTLAGGERAPGVARVAAAMLDNAGLAELAAGDADHYVSLAAGLAADPRRLADLRAGLRQRVAACALGDVDALARALESAWRRLWLQRPVG
ncbi:tetratricopeptide (TPR) repeat protein [Azospirillum fermentarium]|uniref:tetratricopeptide repeat protein n=1 Tax=Azospirillum fermentarium TaxID=1233114 RepID=UPI0022261EC7|nr:hypothetical protein [Azospirillum fermentarium]MCW2247600.1 tetratricopeptide (TPR) repeat protein [Azospirillum fermentarium]